MYKSTDEIISINFKTTNTFKIGLFTKYSKTKYMENQSP